MYFACNVSVMTVLLTYFELTYLDYCQRCGTIILYPNIWANLFGFRPLYCLPYLLGHHGALSYLWPRPFLQGLHQERLMF
ncbi:hypothetical protein BS78_05G268100 [Paspalum vaginatum]|nr:hypothetical protein BS78_05G268100 [Paspalum vaginatum]